MQVPSSENDIESPFSAARAHPVASGGKKSPRPLLRIVLGSAALALLLAGGFFLFSYLNDPYRKLEEFPVARYFDGYQALSGLKFRAGLRVEADLGWKDGVGRLMVFTPDGDTRQLAALIPPGLSNVFFNKGQTYTAALEVKEGGLIHVDSCRKN